MTPTQKHDNSTPNETKRTCWLAQTGKIHQKADREQLELSETDAEDQLEGWRDDLDTENRWFETTEMRAVVADTGQEEH